MITRRGFLKSTASVLLGSYLCLPAKAHVSFDSEPFKLGIASGCPMPNSVALWTRLAPKPLEGGGLEKNPIAVKWEVARDEAFRKIVKSGQEIASPAYAHSERVDDF